MTDNSSIARSGIELGTRPIDQVRVARGETVHIIVGNAMIQDFSIKMALGRIGSASFTPHCYRLGYNIKLRFWGGRVYTAPTPGKSRFSHHFKFNSNREGRKSMSLMNLSKRIVNVCFGVMGLQVTRLANPTVVLPPKVVSAPEKESLLSKEEKAMYLTTFGPDVFERRPFLNVGAGDFRHPAWRNLDFYTEAYASDVRSNMDIEMDLSNMERWPIPDNSIEAIFTSHTIEHLRDDHDRHIFAESLRVLKPGGVIRVTCPDIELYFRAMRRGDRHFFLNYAPTWVNEDIEQLFLREFATQISTANNDGLPISKVTSKEISDVFNTMNMEDGLNEFSRRIDYKTWYKLAPGNHVNWWSYDKLFRFLRDAGFGEMYRSGFGQSLCRPMRFPLFDWTAKNISLYAEAYKPLSSDATIPNS